MNLNYIGLYTIIKREIKRTTKIVNQVIWPPIISTLLYSFVFGISLGSKIPEIEGIPYLHFLIPGLIMMSIIENSYSEGSASLFINKFLNNLQDILAAPLSSFEIVLGYVLGGVIRGVFIGNLIYFVSKIFLKYSISDYFYYITFMVLVSTIFSSIGMIVALWADDFDDLAVLSTFFITPLVFFGGVFHSIRLLPQSLQNISLYNPLFYMIDGFRYGITGVSSVPVLRSLALVVLFTVLSFGLAFYLFSRGYKIRQ
jgi:ABC-2 type transport system permease protein